MADPLVRFLVAIQLDEALAAELSERLRATYGDRAPTGPEIVAVWGAMAEEYHRGSASPDAGE